MSVIAPVKTAAAKPQNSDSQLVFQRKCACGASAGLAGECAGCQRNRLLGHPLQRKLVINDPGDEYEKEADRAADQVMGVSDASVNSGATLSGKTPIVQRTVAGNSAAGIGAAPPIVRDVLSSPGRPMDAATRTLFQSRFGHDFSHVRVHSDAKAAESARAVNAWAYTTGSDIVFGAGQYVPRAQTGQHLLAHELAHVMQGAPGIHRFRKGGKDLATELEEGEDEMVEAGDISGEAPSPFDVFLSEAVYDRLTRKYTVDQVYPDLFFLEGEWPYDVGAFYDLLSKHATFVDMAEADFGLIQPQTLSETEFYALRSMEALEEFFRFYHLHSRFLDPDGKFVEPASLQDYRRTLTRPGDRAEFGSAQDAIDSFRTRILTYVEPTYNLLLQLSRETVMTASGPISSFHAAMFGLYLQTGNPMQTGPGGEMDPLALALEEYAGFEDASQVANLLQQGFRKAYLKGVSGNPALAMLAQAYSDRMGNTRTQPIRSPFSIIRPETVALVNSMFSFPIFDLTTTLNAMPPQAIAVRASAVGAFISLLKKARNPAGIYAVVRHFEGSAIDRTALYRNFLGIEPEWLDVASQHRYILKDSSTYRYPPEPPDSSMSQEQWDLVTKLEEARSRRAVAETITGLLAIGASVAAGIVAGVFTGGNPVVTALVASATAAAFGLVETSAAVKHLTITSAAHMAQEREGLPFGSEELADFALEEFERTRQAAIANTLIAAATGGIGGPALGPGSHWIKRGLVSMGMGGFDGLASALADPRVMDEDFQRDKVVLMGGDPASAPTAFEGVTYQVFISALFGGVTHGVIEGAHFRVAGNGTERPKVSLDGVDISGAEVAIVVDPAGELRVVRDGAEWSHEAVSDLEQTLRRVQQEGRTSEGRNVEPKSRQRPAPAPSPTPVPRPVPEARASATEAISEAAGPTVPAAPSRMEASADKPEGAAPQAETIRADLGTTEPTPDPEQRLLTDSRMGQLLLPDYIADRAAAAQRKNLLERQLSKLETTRSARNKEADDARVRLENAIEETTATNLPNINNLNAIEAYLTRVKGKWNFVPRRGKDDAEVPLPQLYKEYLDSATREAEIASQLDPRIEGLRRDLEAVNSELARLSERFGGSGYFTDPVLADLIVSPGLPKPAASAGYVPTTEGHRNGFRAELRLANWVVEVQGHTVVKYGDPIGVQHSDVISIDSNGNVTLWDSKWHNKPVVEGQSNTFTDPINLHNAILDARAAIGNAQHLNNAARVRALDNLDRGNFTVRTVSSTGESLATNPLLPIITGDVQWTYVSGRAK